MKKKAVLVTSYPSAVESVYVSQIKQQLSERYDFYGETLCKENLSDHLDAAHEAEFIFSTWGMEHFTEEEIQQYFPKVKHLFYAAGSVQEFAREFLDSGVRVYSAWKANAVPVAEFTYAQILLSTKGFWKAARTQDASYAAKCGGNYHAKVGIIGVGTIGALVAEKLKANEMEVLYYDPFLPQERAEKMGILSASLEKIFTQCDVISNHLANKEELNGILNGNLFSKMKPYATFINTGRGRQVDHDALLEAMREVDTRTALLDVTYPEPLPKEHGLWQCGNVIITPHIAGSIGREVVRMARFMLDEAERVEAGEEPLYEVTAEMLAHMA